MTEQDLPTPQEDNKNPWGSLGPIFEQLKPRLTPEELAMLTPKNLTIMVLRHGRPELFHPVETPLMDQLFKSLKEQLREVSDSEENPWPSLDEMEQVTDADMERVKHWIDKITEPLQQARQDRHEKMLQGIVEQIRQQYQP